MNHEDFYEKNVLADQIVLLAIYMSILHQEIQSFVWMWNCHTICKQSKQSNAVTEKSYMLYNWLQTLKIEKMSLKSNSELLFQLVEKIAVYDMLLFL